MLEGISPSNSLCAKFNVIKLRISDISSGNAPVNMFCARSRVTSSVKFPICGNIVPERLFSRALTYRSFVRFPILEGKLPENSLIVDGRLPKNSFSSSKTTLSLRRRDKLRGSGPFNLFFVKSRTSRFSKLQKLGDTVPLKLQWLKFRCLMDLNCTMNSGNGRRL
ncbi:unnamed protein product [Cuscuta campestris]|uniref:Uncharacterized protein n=1 Tax=Cuscuta campestris TaxID=132261 RepID=A0A484MN12_9ASTE|nr:unnamed protein product [Cuscuta campestris]